MTNKEFDAAYWQQRWEQSETGWDIGYASTPLKTYIDQLEHKNMSILIPGCGNAHEGIYLHENGFTNVHLVDMAPLALEKVSQHCPSFPKENLICKNFFDLMGSYDLMLEQTFFCALNPKLRAEYAKKVKELLKPDGKLVGVLFNIPLYEDHPPFGGDKAEYLDIFQNGFKIAKMEEAHNSIPPRAGNELFINLKKA